MNANDRRVLCLEALNCYHEKELDIALSDEDAAAREKLNNIAKAFLKIAKLLSKKKIAVNVEAPKVYTKKEFKALLKGKVLDDEEVEEDEVEEEETEQEDEED